MDAGPRRTGEGVEDEEQGIISAESAASGYNPPIKLTHLPYTSSVKPTTFLVSIK